MAIQITITIPDGDTLEGMLTRAGLIRPRPALVQAEGDFLAAARERAADTHRAIVENEKAAEAPSAAPAVDQNRVESDADAKRKRRTKAEMEAARAAEAAAAAPEPAAPVFTVRRFDGGTDADFADSGEAADRLTELVNNAGEKDALNALWEANAEMVARLPRERADEIRNILAGAFAAFNAPKPAAAPAAPPASGYKDLDGNPVSSISPDKKGAQNAIMNVARGAEPLGFMAAKAILDSFGVAKVSELPDGDPKLAEIARKGAALLGLPMAGEGGLL